MTLFDFQTTFTRLVSAWESECVEFKEASNDYDTDRIGHYVSALANEANLRARESAWLVFGVSNKTRKPVGTDYREDTTRLHGLKQQIHQDTKPSHGLREIHEGWLDGKRLLLFEIPASPRGTPVSWKGHYYARSGESLGPLELIKLDQIRAQSPAEDWSAGICSSATLADLDPTALAKARAQYRQRYATQAASIPDGDDAAFLDRAKITIKGSLTRTALLLLGKEESVHHLLPSVGEITWKLEGEERSYQHFGPPFILTTSHVFQRIRNLRLKLLPFNQLLPVEVDKYEQDAVLEALHNCVAHQDYSLHSRIILTERPDRLIFENAGSFFEGTPTDYVLTERSPQHYRNRFLTVAMRTLGMIDTMGYGIRDMFLSQRRRYLPLPDYDLSDPGKVRLTLYGRFIDENYSRLLLARTDLLLPDVLAIDQLQKGSDRQIDGETLKHLRKDGLVEGRKPNLHVAAEIAAATDEKAGYIRARAFDDRYYRDLILEYLRKFESGTRTEFFDLLAPKLSDLLGEAQKARKIGNLLQFLKKRGIVEVEGTTRAGVWRLSKEPPSAD
jgi:ATP-dependent DNA helicase RecG